MGGKIMKKVNYIILFIGILFLTVTNVKAANITNVTYDGNFNIEGTGNGTVEIVLFDLDNNPIYLTTATTTNNNFSIKLPKISGLKTGKYKIKISDYNGSNVDTKNVKVTIMNEENPNTFDNIIIVSIILGISVIGMIGCTIYLKKRSHN